MPLRAIAELEARLVANIVGGRPLVRSLLIALLADGHVLLDGAPGLAKTRAVTLLAEGLEATFRRVALGPGQGMAHLFGREASVAAPPTGPRPLPDPAFVNILLAEGLDRASAEVRFALLDAMTERQILVGGVPTPLPAVFLVCATRTLVPTPSGPMPLGLDELDRFLLHVRVAYPDEADERRVLDLVRAESGMPAGGRRPAAPPLPLAVVLAARACVQAVRTGPRILRMITALVAATRAGRASGNGPARWIRSGAGPRGSIALERSARAHAWLAGRCQVTDRDVAAVVHDVLRHRIELTEAAIAEGITADSMISEQFALARP